MYIETPGADSDLEMPGVDRDLEMLDAHSVKEETGADSDLEALGEEPELEYVTPVGASGLLVLVNHITARSPEHIKYIKVTMII